MFNPFHLVPLLASARQSLRFLVTSWRFTHRILTVSSRFLAPASRLSSQVRKILYSFPLYRFQGSPLSVTGFFMPLLPDSLVIIANGVTFCQYFFDENQRDNVNPFFPAKPRKKANLECYQPVANAQKPEHLAFDLRHRLIGC